MSGPSVEACLVRLSSATRNPWPTLPVLALYVSRWDPLPTAPVQGVTLTLYECDYPDETSTAQQDPIRQQELLKVVFDLVPAVPASTAADASAHKGCAPVLAIAATPKPKVTRLYWPGSRTLTSFPTNADARGKSPHARFVLLLSGEQDAYVPVAIPQDDAAHAHAEGEFYEIGMTLEHAGLSPPVQRLTSDRVAASWIPADSLKTVLGLSTKLDGAIAHDKEFVAARMDAVTDPKTQRVTKKVRRLGRFNDPDRNPRVEPEEAAARLDEETIAALARHPTQPVNVDGLRFRNFVHPAERQTAIQELAAKVKLKKLARRVGKEVEEVDPPEWKTTDIQKAFFVIHDVGDAPGSIQNKPSRYTYPLSPTSKGGVNGYVNTDGSYALAADFAGGGQGTVYAATSSAGPFRPYFIDIESVLDSSKTDASLTVPAYLGADTKKSPQFASVAFSGTEGDGSDWTGYSKWTHDTLDTLALLYVLASARADHLLTVTAHVETDRSLGYSRIFFNYDAGTLYGLRSTNPGWGFWKLLHSPGDAHGDPTGLDFQVFYEKVTDLLNDLKKDKRGTLELPRGVFYGIHPARVAVQDGGRLRTHGNRSAELNTFPHQSATTFRAASDLDPAAKKTFTERYQNDGRHGRPGPWWHAEFKAGVNVYKAKGVLHPVEQLKADIAAAARKQKEEAEAKKKEAAEKKAADEKAAAAKKAGGR